MTVATKPITAEELFAMPNLGRCELINGEINPMAPAGVEHGGVSIDIGSLIRNFVHEKRIGKVYGAETGFTISRNPDTVRAPDVAFVTKARLPKSPRRGFFEGPPDLAVEVVSPGDSHSEVTAKVNQWLAAGAPSVWVVDPPNRNIEVYRPHQPVLRNFAADELTDEPLLPGFVPPVGEIFEMEE